MLSWFVGYVLFRARVVSCANCLVVCADCFCGLCWVAWFAY